MPGEGAPSAEKAPSAEEERLALALKGLSVMRHDVRNLLSSVGIIASRLEALGDDRLTKAGGEITGAMEGVIALGMRTQDLVETAPAPRAAVPVRRLIERAAEAVGAAVETGGIGEEALFVNEDQAATALEVLIDNAVRAGGATPPSVAAAAQGDMVVLRVTDQGKGIPDYAVDMLFVPFAGMKRRGGSGLGLPLAARLAAANGGSVSLERTGPEGTQMQLVLPAAGGAA